MIKLALIVCLFGLSGCFAKMAVNSKLTPGEVKEYNVSHTTQWGSAEITTDCEKGVAAIEQGVTFGDYFICGLTLTLYCPRTSKITCAG